MDPTFDKKQIKEIFSSIDVYQNNSISYTEFITATLTKQKLFNIDKINNFYKGFDLENKEKISRKEFIKLFGKIDSDNKEVK